MNRRALLVSLGGLSVLALGVVGAARAAPGAAPTLEFSIIHATRSDAGTSIDPALKDLPQLTREQPFVRYNVYRLLDRKAFPFEMQDGSAASKPLTMPLPNGRTLMVILESVSVEKNEKRYQLQAQISEPGKQAYLKDLHVTASAGEPFFVGGQSFRGGVLFLELLIKP